MAPRKVNLFVWVHFSEFDGCQKQLECIEETEDNTEGC